LKDWITADHVHRKEAELAAQQLSDVHVLPEGSDEALDWPIEALTPNAEQEEPNTKQKKSNVIEMGREATDFARQSEATLDSAPVIVGPGTRKLLVTSPDATQALAQLHEAEEDAMACSHSCYQESPRLKCMHDCLRKRYLQKDMAKDMGYDSTQEATTLPMVEEAATSSLMEAKDTEAAPRQAVAAKPELTPHSKAQLQEAKDHEEATLAGYNAMPAVASHEAQEAENARKNLEKVLAAAEAGESAAAPTDTKQAASSLDDASAFNQMDEQSRASSEDEDDASQSVADRCATACFPKLREERFACMKTCMNP
jgi:hypothetical protein